MRYFIDIDGTLAVYPQKDGWWLIPEAYSNLEPQTKVIKAVKRLVNAGQDVYILSACPDDESLFKSVRDAKNGWLDRYLPEVGPERRLFMICGQNKADFVPGGVSEDDILLDDYTANLKEWFSAGGTGIKLLNGINSKKSWDGLSASASGPIKDIVLVLKLLQDAAGDPARDEDRPKRPEDDGSIWPER